MKFSLSWNLLGTEKVQQISELWVKYKKVIETQKCKQAAWTPLFCWFLTYDIKFDMSQLLNGLPVCAEFFRIILSHVYLSSEKVS